MRWLALWCSCTAFAQNGTVTPAVVRQGETLHVHAAAEIQTVRMEGRSARLFIQTDGRSLGLMPVPADQKPGVYRLEFLDKGGSARGETRVTVRDAHFQTQNIVLNEKLRELKPSAGEVETTAAFRKTVSDIRYWSEPLAAPVHGCMTSPFGVKRMHNGKLTGAIHAGVDLRGSSGSPVRAIAAGRVKIAQQFSLHGGTVGIDHGQGLESMYLHLSKFAVAEGAAVQRGEVIGYIGSTGRSTAPHLHWSLYVEEVPVNPAQWMPLRACAQGKKRRR